MACLATANIILNYANLSIIEFHFYMELTWYVNVYVYIIIDCGDVIKQNKLILQ
jgi:hypothetical protein